VNLILEFSVAGRMS